LSAGLSSLGRNHPHQANFQSVLLATLRLPLVRLSFTRAGMMAPGRENLDLVSLPNALSASGRVAAAHVQAVSG
jgi:hypothetical protein